MYIEAMGTFVLRANGQSDHSILDRVDTNRRKDIAKQVAFFTMKYWDIPGNPEIVQLFAFELLARTNIKMEWYAFVQKYAMKTKRLNSGTESSDTLSSLSASSGDTVRVDGNIWIFKRLGEVSRQLGKMGLSQMMCPQRYNLLPLHIDMESKLSVTALSRTLGSCAEQRHDQARNQRESNRAIATPRNCHKLMYLLGAATSYIILPTPRKYQLVAALDMMAWR